MKPGWRSSLVVAVAVQTITLLSTAPASAVYTTATSYSSKAAPEARELSGLIASPTYPNWYWAESDVWKSTDVFAACSGLADSDLSRCQQIQRARLWAIRLDPVTHKVRAVRGFSIADPEWALDPHLAQNNDWEDLDLGPLRTAPDGSASQNLLISATGNAVQNRVYDAAGDDITCETRRLIELREPNLADPSVTTWSPWKIYDLQNISGTHGLTTCNMEALVVANDPSGAPQGYLVTQTGQKLFSRSLEDSTGRSPEQPFVPAGSDATYDPTITYLGAVKGAAKLKISAAATNGADVSLLVPKTGAYSCQVLTWHITGDGLASTLLGSLPDAAPFGCAAAEGLAYVRDPVNPAKISQDLVLMNDSATLSVIKYWYAPWTP